MILQSGDISELHALAVAAATNAGRLIAERASDSFELLHKDAGSSLASQLLTEVDLLSDKIILEHLMPSCDTYDLALLSEEREDDGSRLKKDYFWCVDPLDGTLVFTESKPGYSVAIALVSRHGEPQIGVIYDPVTHDCLSAIRGQGVRLNGEPWSPGSDAIEKTAALSWICDRGFTQRPDYARYKNALDAVCQQLGLELQLLDTGAGAVINAWQVLRHQPACYFKVPKSKIGGGSIWDFAATAAVFSELGLPVTDYHGQALDLNRPASTYMNEKGVLFASDPQLTKALVKLL